MSTSVSYLCHNNLRDELTQTRNLIGKKRLPELRLKDISQLRKEKKQKDINEECSIHT